MASEVESSSMSTQILVVDDEKELADVLELYLVSDGYTVHKCYTGAEALECMEHTDLDMAILDVMLPDVDGSQICKIIREKFWYLCERQGVVVPSGELFEAV